MVPAARKGDEFKCPSHGGGIIQGPCCFHVQIGGAAAARVGDCGACGGSGSFDAIRAGNPTVQIAGEAAAGRMHSMAHGGMVVKGCSSVYIGQPIVDANGNLVPVPPECDFVWRWSAPWPDNMDRFRSPSRVERTGKHVGRYMALAPWGEKRYIQSETFVVTIRGRQILVYAPANRGSIPDFPDYYSVQRVLAALSALSDEQLDAVKEVYFNPVLSPDDPYWRKEYEDPNHVSAAAAGPGHIYLFPTGNYGDQGSWDRLLQHEAAHAVWHERPELHAKWWEAIQKDRRSVSDYGNKAPSEDFAEAVAMYSRIKGTPCEATMRAAFPARFALIEDVFRRGYAAPQKQKGKHR